MGRRLLLTAACSGLSPSLPALCGSLTSQSACRGGATDACVPAHRRSAPTAATAPAPSAHLRHGPTTPTGGRPTPVAVVTPRGCERAHPPQRVAPPAVGRRRGATWSACRETSSKYAHWENGRCRAPVRCSNGGSRAGAGPRLNRPSAPAALASALFGGEDPPADGPLASCRQ